jgi:hypothetical protein
MNIYMNRFGQQVECVATETLLSQWSASVGAGLPPRRQVRPWPTVISHSRFV